MGRSLLLVGLMLGLSSCVTAPEVVIGNEAEEEYHATQIMQEREQALAALRADVASTRVAAAKQEAELQALRTTVTHLRQENREFLQALLEAKRTIEARETEIVMLKTEREPLEQSQSLVTGEQKLAVLQETVASLHQDLQRLKQSLAVLPPQTASVSAESHLEQTTRESSPSGIVSAMYVVPEVPNNPKARRVTIRRGDTLVQIARRYHTTVEALQKVNGLMGHRVSVGQELRLP